MSAVPKLRFPEFDGEWKTQVLGNFLQRIVNRVPADTELPVFSSSRGGLKPQDDYFDGRRLDNLGEYGVVPNNSITYRHMSDDLTFKFNLNDLGYPIAVSKEYPVFATVNMDVKYLIYWLNYSNHFKKFAILQKLGGTRTRLYFRDLERWQCPIPSLPEQQKIASFLSSADKKIDLLRQKKDALELYKKGLMQKIFSQEIRFKQDDGSDFPDWQEVALGEIVDRVKRKNTSGNTNVLTISAQMGLVSQLDYFNKSVSSANLSGYTLLQNGDFAYNKSYSNGYPVGAIKRQIRYDFGVVSPLYICFRPHDHDIGNYLEIYLDSYFVVQDISKIMQEGARNHGLINISVSDFFDFVSIPLPCSDERQKITSYFGALDAKLKIASSQVEQMETFKKGLLQQMFV